MLLILTYVFLCSKRYYKDMIDEFKWRIYELKRLHRLYVEPEPSVKRLIKAVGVFWLWRHGAKREHRVYPWKNRREWYAVDLALPHKKRGVEADGWSHKGQEQRDVIRDHRLEELGWRILRIDDEDVKSHPRREKYKVRKFLKR